MNAGSVLCLAAAGALALAACGRRAPADAHGAGRTVLAPSPAESAPGPPPPALAETGGTGELRPLTPADVELYARVMREAARRLDRAPATEAAAPTRAAAQERSTAGTDPGPLSPDVRSSTLAAAPPARMDDRIVRDHQLDAARYGLVRDRIESILAGSTAPAAAGLAVLAGGAVSAEHAQFLSRERARVAADSAVLAPRRVELRALIRRVRAAGRPRLP